VTIAFSLAGISDPQKISKMPLHIPRAAAKASNDRQPWPTQHPVPGASVSLGNLS